MQFYRIFGYKFEFGIILYIEIVFLLCNLTIHAPFLLLFLNMYNMKAILVKSIYLKFKFFHRIFVLFS